MKFYCSQILLLLFVLGGIKGQAQDSFLVPKEHNFKWQHVIVPSIGIGYGVAAQILPSLDQFDHTIKDKIYYRNQKITIDDYIQYAPAGLVFGLNALGYKSKNNFVDRSIQLMSSAIIVAPTVHLIKNTTKALRPDGSSYNSFPSGHTATAFVAATFMWLEYKEVNPWLAYSGFVFAGTTGVLRMYNNRHWFSDVIMGGSIGFLATYGVYQAYPYIKKWIFNLATQSSSNSWLAMPQIGPQYMGIQLCYTIK